MKRSFGRREHGCEIQMSKSKTQKVQTKRLEKRKNEGLRSNSFLNFVSVEDTYKKSPNRLTKQYTLQTTSGKIIDSEKTLYDAVSNASFPMDPPNGGLWDGLADSLFGGFLSPNFEYDFVDIFWLNADGSAAASPTFFVKVIKWFAHVAMSVSPMERDEPFYEEGGVILRLFLVCSSEERARALRRDLNLPY